MFKLSPFIGTYYFYDTINIYTKYGKIIMIPVNGLIAKIMKSLQKQHMENKDSRTKLMTEVRHVRLWIRSLLADYREK